MAMPMLSLILLLGAQVPPDSKESAPPIELQATPGSFGERTLYQDAAGASVKVQVRIHTIGREMCLRYRARAATPAAPCSLSRREPVTFFPTAWEFSRTHPDVLYVMGAVGSRPFLERWTLEPSLPIPAGDRSTDFATPAITKERLPIDPALSHVCSMTVNPWPRGGGPEEIWAFDWDSKNVYALDRKTGAKELRVSAEIARRYGTIEMKEHSIYGAVCLFWTFPYFAERDVVPAWWASDTSIAVCDTDHDGVIDKTFAGEQAIVWGDYQHHPLYVKGTFLPRDR